MNNCSLIITTAVERSDCLLYFSTYMDHFGLIKKKYFSSFLLLDKKPRKRNQSNNEHIQIRYYR